MPILRFIFRGLLLMIVWLTLLIGVLWAYGAFWFDFPVAALRHPLAIAFAVGAVAVLLFLRPRWRAKLGVAVAIALVMAWWFTIRPTNTADWQPDVAREPFAEIDGDTVVIQNFRNFDYRTENDYEQHWETKTVHLSNLRGLDLFLDYWGSPLICHTFVSFDFGPDGYVCASIETRKKVGQSYAAIPGFYRQYTLCYVIGDERDIVRLRTNYRHEDLYLYRALKATPEKSRELFLDYMRTAKQFREHPKWYNAVTSNCTSNIRLHVKSIGSAQAWSWELLVNGYIDRHMYAVGAIDNALPFAELRRLSYISKRGQAADEDPAFSARIRDGLPAMPPAVLPTTN